MLAPKNYTFYLHTKQKKSSNDYCRVQVDGGAVILVEELCRFNQLPELLTFHQTESFF